MNSVYTFFHSSKEYSSTDTEMYPKIPGFLYLRLVKSLKNTLNAERGLKKVNNCFSVGINFIPASEGCLGVFRSLLLFDGFFRCIDFCRYKNSGFQVVMYLKNGNMFLAGFTWFIRLKVYEISTNLKKHDNESPLNHSTYEV